MVYLFIFTTMEKQASINGSLLRSLNHSSTATGFLVGILTASMKSIPTLPHTAVSSLMDKQYPVHTSGGVIWLDIQ